MKAKDLIKLLQDEDPTGEIECCIANSDILSVHTEPAYLDGRLQILERDHSLDPYYNIIGAKRTCRGNKIVITPYSIDDYITNDPEIAKIDYSEVGSESSAQNYREADERIRQTMIAIQLDVTIKGFFEWASGILTSLKPDSKPNEFKGYCSEFFVKNRTLLEAYPELPTRQEKHGDQTYTVHASVREREIAHWNNVIEFSQRTWEPTMRIKNEFNTEVVE
jgi:hypothetical protein